MTSLYRYSRWDGTQAVEPFTASDMMDYLADKVLDAQFDEQGTAQFSLARQGTIQD